MSRAENFKLVEYLLIHGTADGEFQLIRLFSITDRFAISLLTKQKHEGQDCYIYFNKTVLLSTTHLSWAKWDAESWNFKQSLSSYAFPTLPDQKTGAAVSDYVSFLCPQITFIFSSQLRSPEP